MKVLRDAEIFALAIPALFSVLLDPLLSLVDTGGCGFLFESHEAAVMGCLCEFAALSSVSNGGQAQH